MVHFLSQGPPIFWMIFSHLYTETFIWKLYSPVDFDKCFKCHTEKFPHLKMFWLEPLEVLLSPKTLIETESFHNPCSFLFLECPRNWIMQYTSCYTLLLLLISKMHLRFIYAPHSFLFFFWLLSHCIGGTDIPWFVYPFSCWKDTFGC